MAGIEAFGFIFLCCVHFVRTDECVTYAFENDVDSHFVNDKGVCATRELPAWEVRSYSEVDLPSPHPSSASFVSPPRTLGCSETFSFTMTGGGTFPNTPNGIIEANIFFNLNSTFDYIIMSVEYFNNNGQVVSIGQASVTSSGSNFVRGWQKLRIERVARFGVFQAHLTFQGRAANEHSLVVVDSFRYIPPDMDEDLCVIYEDLPETTEAATTENTTAPTDSTTETEPETTSETSVITSTESSITSTTAETIDTTEEIDNLEKCVTYNFETDYDVLFSTDNYICNGFLPWQLENYTTFAFDSPSPASTVFITPHEDISCISSLVFKMEPGGTVEAKVFMEPTNDMDHIIVQAYKVTDREYDTIAGLNMYHQDNEAFVFGWNVISFTIFEPSPFDGYLIFIGSAEKRSTVLVDSVRYIPPLTPPEHTSCDIY